MYEKTWVENAAIVETKFTKCNVAKEGFPTFNIFLEWVYMGPVMLQLNHDVHPGKSEEKCTLKKSGIFKVINTMHVFSTVLIQETNWLLKLLTSGVAFKNC